MSQPCVKPKQNKGSRPKKLHRLSGIDSLAIREVLLVTSLAVEPDDQTQRREFSSLLPTIYILRNKERFTFKQITSLLHKSGIKLAVSSVRVYYSQMIALREEECIIEMEEWALLKERITQERKNMEITSIGEKVTKILEKK